MRRRARDVDTVISGGKIIVKDRKPVTFDLEEVIAEAQEAADKLGTGRRTGILGN